MLRFGFWRGADNTFSLTITPYYSYMGPPLCCPRFKILNLFGTGKLELVKYHVPAEDEGPQPWPANRPGFRHICIEVEDLNAIVDRLRDEGFDTVGEVQDYADVDEPIDVRGPEGLIVELAENIASARAS